MPQDQDPFNTASLQGPAGIIASYNALDEESMARGAINWRHAPASYKLVGGSHSAFGLHGPTAHPGYEVYRNWAPVGASPSAGVPFPEWDPVSFGGTVMCASGTGAPYGKNSVVGWSIIAKNNTVATSARIYANMPYNGTGSFDQGEAAIDVSGYVEACNAWGQQGDFSAGSGPYQDDARMGPILAVALRIDGNWYIVPDSMAMYDGTLMVDSIHCRTRVTAAMCRTMDATGVTLEYIALAVTMRGDPDWESGDARAGIRLGCWGISADPFIGDAV